MVSSDFDYCLVIFDFIFVALHGYNVYFVARFIIEIFFSVPDAI